MDFDSNMDDLIPQFPPLTGAETISDDIFRTLSASDSEAMANMTQPAFKDNFNYHSTFGSHFDQPAGQNSCCVNKSIEILRNLHTMPSMCFSTGTHGSPGADHKRQRTIGRVLSTNREAVHSIMKMLECACFSNLDVQVMLSTICYKIIVWYRAIINSSRNLSKWPEDVSEDILHQPITLGDYTVDFELQSQLRIQVIYGELHRFELLLREFLNRMDLVSNDLGSQKNGTTGLQPTPEQRQSLRSYLSEQFDTTKAEISALRGGGNR